MTCARMACTWQERQTRTGTARREAVRLEICSWTPGGVLTARADRCAGT